MSNAVLVGGGDIDTVATIGTILAGISINVGSIQVGTVQVVGTIAGTLVPLESVGTIGTILSGAVTATISSGQLADVGTIGTILARVGITQPTGTVVGTSGQFQGTMSGTIRGSGGTLYGVIATSEQGTGTVLLIHSAGAVLARVIVPSGDTRGFMLANGIAYTGSLIASLMGTLAVSVVT